MGGLFGIVSKEDCVEDLFYGVDYHSHLGTEYGGILVKHHDDYMNRIHEINTMPFRSRFEDDVKRMKGRRGIGVISDTDPQPRKIDSHLGTYGIATVGVIRNLSDLKKEIFSKGGHISETRKGIENVTEFIANLINQEGSFEAGIKNAQNKIQGSCSLLLLTEKGIYAARDKLGRTPLIIGYKEDFGYAVTSETTALPNLHYDITNYLGPGEIMLINEDNCDQLGKPNNDMQLCSFLLVYYGYPSSSYEGINVEVVRNRCGMFLAKNDVKDNLQLDMVAGIPDSGIAHAIGYANESKVPYGRPFVKYTPSWPRSFMPQDQSVRDNIAKMKLITINEMIQGKRMLFCEDSIVRGTQLRPFIERLFRHGALEVHMRPACPPLVYGCDYLNFSRSKSVMDLAARQAIREIEGPTDHEKHLEEYTDAKSDKYELMVKRICHNLGLTSLKYQLLENLVKAIGLPEEKLCKHCWDGKSHF